jgi:pantoate--beta-alanine ligase
LTSPQPNYTARVIDTIAELRQQLGDYRRKGERIAFVPTLGNLHEGHLRLVTTALGVARRVVVSLFVNPMQFAPGTDYERYPRTVQADVAKLQSTGEVIVFAPERSEMYPQAIESSTQVHVPQLSDLLCGEFRPGHFVGVATIVTKLFNIVQPDYAVFGEKDYQQLAIIRKMVEDLNLPIQILGVETVREADGLAKSSRNQYLDERQRRIAPYLYHTLISVGELIKKTKAVYSVLENEAMDKLRKEGFEPEYFRICNPNSLMPAAPELTEVRLIAAAWLGSARLIDNIAVTRQGRE